MQKIIIIGAPRSGTNMLRDVLTSFKGIGSWPCDEINYIWRHGNVRYPTDEFPIGLATNKIKKYINNQFELIRKKQNCEIIVEKTCANSLRVPFINEIIPDAKFIYIYRDGLDALASAKLRWKAELDLSYLLKKVRYVPKTDLLYYGSRYFWSRIYRLLSKQKRLAFWGPALADMQNLLCQYSLNEVCALQWQACVDKAEEAFSQMEKDKVIKVKYEDFVTSPKDELKRILGFIDYETCNETIKHAVIGISNKNIGKGRQYLGQSEISHLEGLLGNTLNRYGYL